MKQQPSSGLKAFLVTILFLILGFLTLWLASTILKIQQGAVLVAILLIPIFAYMILSDKLLEFSAGGVTAKFNVVVQSLVFYEALNEIGSIEVRKGGRWELERFLNDRGQNIEDEDVVLTVKFHPSDLMYDNKDLLDYLRGLSRYQNFSFLVILDQNEKVCAYTSSWRAIEILEYELEARMPGSSLHNFADAINASQSEDLEKHLKELVRYYGLVTIPALTTETNLEVLKKMIANRMDALIVTNEKGKLRGVVKRGQLLSKLMLATAKNA